MEIYILLGILAVFLIVAYICYRMSFYNTNRYEDPFYYPDDFISEEGRNLLHSLIISFQEIPYEEVIITSNDGLKLYGRYYHVKDGAPIQIQLHGFHGNAYRDFCGGNKLAREKGFNTLVVDQRSHGKSEGNCITFGIKESEDCLCWINYLVDRFGSDCKIILAGVSMGAATVLMATELDLPSNVKGVIADCPFSSPSKMIKKVIKEDMHLPAKILFPFVWLGGVVYGHFNISKTSALKAMEKCNVPILLIHGLADTLVPPYMSKEVYDACKTKKYILLVEGATHAVSYIKDERAYINQVEEFVQEVLK